MTKEIKKIRPTHRLYAVTDNGGKKFWQPIGGLWAHADGNGFHLRLDYLPLNDAELVVRVSGDKQAEASGDAQNDAELVVQVSGDKQAEASGVAQ